MKATEELRRMLDERGVKYHAHYFGTLWAAGRTLHMVEERTDGTLVLDGLTPEQVIAATFGERTCELDGTIKWDWGTPGPYWQHELSCGHVVTTTEPEPPNYCEECGAKVVK